MTLGIWVRDPKAFRVTVLQPIARRMRLEREKDEAGRRHNRELLRQIEAREQERRTLEAARSELDAKLGGEW